MSSINNPFTSKVLLDMLDSDINETSQPQQQQQQSNNNNNGNNTNINGNMNGSQQSQQLMMAAMLNQQRQSLNQHQFQQQMQPQGQGQGQMQGGGHGQMQGGQGGGQQQVQQQQAQGQGQGQGQMMQPMNSQQQQIQDFLNRQGHNLTPQQRATLQQQLVNVQNNAPGMNHNMNIGQGGTGQAGGGGGMNMPANNADNSNSANNPDNSPAPGGVEGLQSVMSMDDLMLRQREQLRHLQVMLKTQHTQDDQGQVLGQDMRGGGNMGQSSGNMGQSPCPGPSPAPNQQQLQQAASINIHSQIHQQHPNMQMNQQQQQQQQQQQKIQQMSQHSSAVMQQMIQQRQMQANASQQQQQQLKQMQAPQSQLPSQQLNLQNPQEQQPGKVMRRSALTPQQQGLPMNKARSPALSNSMSPQPIVASSDPSPMPSSPMQSASNMTAGAGAIATTKVVPVSVSPHVFTSVQGGGVSEASLIYTKHALESIITSLNASSRKKTSDTGKDSGDTQMKGRVYTIRDLSTCLGAWDLNIPSVPSNNKRAKLEEGGLADISDGNADTAFNFYHERSCPILLDAKRATGIFSVEDYSDDSTATGLPVVTGAAVLTFGADSKFTGGIGEEGVLTKAIFEFFYDPSVALGLESEEKFTEDALIEAEERIFARVDGESSTLINAALHALSPPAAKDKPSTSSSDDGMYIPTIRSGNTNRIYQYCLLGNFDDEGKERASKRLCVAIKKMNNEEDVESGPAKGVCRITLTLSPVSVLAKKKLMAVEKDGSNAYHATSLASTASAVHKNIRQSLRILRPPKLTSVSNVRQSAMLAHAERNRHRLRRTSISQRIDPSLIVVGMRCKHELLLDPDEVGKVYVNGVLVVDCSLSTQKGMKHETSFSSDKPFSALGPDVLPAHTLFGVDFTLDRSENGKLATGLPSRTMLEREYGALLIDALIDADQCDADVAGKLLSRLIAGNTEDNDFDEYDDEVPSKEGLKKDGTHSVNSSSSTLNGRDDFQGAQNDSASKIKFDDISCPCLESVILSSTVADPVGIGAKALGTKFRLQYGKEAFPCEVGTDEGRRLCRLLGAQRVVKPVPRRLRDVLRRGGYLNLDAMARFLWGGNASSWDGDHNDAMRAAEAMEGAIELLRKAGCRDVESNKIRFVARKQLEPGRYSDSGNDDDDSSACRTLPASSQLKCWYDSNNGSYYVNDALLFVEDGKKDGGESVASASTAGHCSVSFAKVTNDASPSEKMEIAPENAQKDDVSTENISGVDDIDNIVDQGSNEEKADNIAEKREEALDEKDNNDIAAGPSPKQSSGHEGQSDEKMDSCNFASVSVQEIRTDGIDVKVKVEEKVKAEHSIEESNEPDQNNEEKSDTDKGESTVPDTTSKNSVDPVKTEPKEECSQEGAEESLKVSGNNGAKSAKYASAKDAAYLLALYIAREHTDAMTLERFVLSHH